MAVKLPRAAKLPRAVYSGVKFARAGKTDALNCNPGSSIMQIGAVLRSAYFFLFYFIFNRQKTRFTRKTEKTKSLEHVPF